VLLHQYLKEDGGKGGPHWSSGLISGNTMMKRKKTVWGGWRARERSPSTAGARGRHEKLVWTLGRQDRLDGNELTADVGQRSRDPMWRVEETANYDETWGKTTVRPRRLAMRKESPNGGLKWQLASGEWAAMAYLGVGEKLQKGGGSFGGWLLVSAEDREYAATGPHDGVELRAQTRAAGT
jgi:hypothetical protein